MPTALVLFAALAASPQVDALFASLPSDVMTKSWGLDAQSRHDGLADPHAVIDRKNGYLELGWAADGILYTLQAAVFFQKDGAPVMAVSYDKGDGALGLTSIVFYRQQGGAWAEVHPLPQLTEADYKIPRGNVPCLGCSLVYSFKLPRQGTVIEARAEYRTTPTAAEAGPGDTYEVHDSYAVALKWDKAAGAFVQSDAPPPAATVHGCQVIRGSKARAEALCLISWGSPFFKFAAQAFGAQTGCEARDESTPSSPSSTLVCHFADGSQYAVEASPPEVSVTTITSAKPFASEQAVQTLIATYGVPGVDWARKSGESTNPKLGTLKRTFWSSDGTNTGADLLYQDGKLVGFAVHSAL